MHLSSFPFLARLPQPLDVATPKLQVHNFVYRLIISPKFKFIALVVLEFLLNLVLKSDFL